ncbi:MAG: leucyl aminopeptidase family protein [Chitinophagaceae bacterium]|nr:leucyl aminopeptidase family protein [Oligoflexus sp.]
MQINFLDSAKDLFPRKGAIFVIGTWKSYQKGFHKTLIPAPLLHNFKESLKSPQLGKSPTSFNSVTGVAEPHKIILSILPDRVSKDNSPSRREWIFQQMEAMEAEERGLVIIAVEDALYLGGAITGIVRRIREVNFKKNAKSKQIDILAVDPKGNPIQIDNVIKVLAQETAWACKVVDLPPNHLNPKVFAKEIIGKFKSSTTVTCTEIVGKNLVKEGLNGIYSVGKAAEEEPRMVILDYKPRGASKTAVLVGKGVCFDSGGLSLKVGGSMVGMKGDMGGAAAVVGAFNCLVKNKYPHRLIVAVALVENAIGPTAYRNDDIITMHSGKTVEVTNTDAEGRLLLADCLSYCARKYKPQLLIDAATLTGAQLVATGLVHAGIISNRSDLEIMAQKIGRESGDLVNSLPFAPELYQNEFKSLVADMCNSVKNRSNAQTSCAAQFVYSHIDDLDIPWLHIDMAGPSSTAAGLATGYGIQLITRLAREYL